MNIKRFIVSGLLACALSMIMYAVPAKHVPCTLTLEDGRIVTAYLCGDETYHFYELGDGTPIVRTADGGYRVTTRKTISDAWTPRFLERNIEHRANAAARRDAGIQGSRAGFTGDKRVLVILVNFQDVQMQANSAQALNEQYNQAGYNLNGHIGSVRDYFLDQSYGQLNLTLDVVGPYTISHNMSYYGGNDESGGDVRPAYMAKEAIQMADGDVDFTKYDWNGNKEVDQVFIVYAGYAEAQGGPDDSVWPHKWCLAYGADGSLKCDGMVVNTYGCSAELTGNSGTDIDGIGTFCHEFSHCLGLQDMYDTKYGGNFGMGRWDLMSSGNYNGRYSGSVPSGYTAFERMELGWLTPKELRTGCYVHNMQPLTTVDEAYVIKNNSNANEYFLLENRQKVRWDAYCPGHGLLIVHVDYDKNIWWNNVVNCTVTDAGNTHQRCTIVPADGLAGNDNGDPYPGSSGNTAFTDSSTPAARFYDGQSTASTPVGKPVTDITEVDGKISFTFMGGSTTSVPVAQDPIEVMPNAFIASWTAVDRATYTLNVQQKRKVAVPSEHLLFQNDFSEGQVPIHYGTVANENERLVVGDISTSGGGIISDNLEAVSGQCITVTFDVQNAGNQSASVGVTLGMLNGPSISYYVPSDYVDVPADHQTVKACVVLHDPTPEECVLLMVTGKVYLDNLKVYDGEYTPEELAEDAAYEVTNCLHQENIDDTQFLVENVNPNDTYYYHVFADVDGSSSANSNTVEVDMPAVIASWPEVVLDDKSSTPPTEQWCRKVTLNRAFTAGKWFTVALPFDMDVPEGWTVQELTSTEGAGTSIMIHFREVDHMEAGKPYMGICSQDVDKVEATMVKVVQNPKYIQNGLVTFFATNTVGKVPEGDFYIKDNKYYYAPTGGVNIQAFRAYFNVGNAPGNTTHYTVDFDGSGMTLVDGLLVDDAPAEVIYDLTGRKVDNPTQGIYVVGGRKVYIK